MILCDYIYNERYYLRAVEWNREEVILYNARRAPITCKMVLAWLITRSIHHKYKHKTNIYTRTRRT